MVVPPEGLRAKVDHTKAHGDPMDVLEPLATAAVAIREYVGKFHEGIPLSGDDIDRLVSWSTSLISSITRIIDARTKVALTANEVVLLQLRMRDLVNEFIAPDRQAAYLEAVDKLTAGAKRPRAALPAVAEENGGDA